MRCNYIREKKILCGDEYMAVGIFSITPTEHSARRKKRKESTEGQKAKNKMASMRRRQRVALANFTRRGFFITATYEDCYLPEDLQAKLGVTEDDAQYAPFDDEDGVNMDDETRLPEEEQREGAAMDIEPAEMEERNERRDEEGVMADPDLTDVAEDFNDEDAQIGDDEEQIDSETE